MFSEYSPLKATDLIQVGTSLSVIEGHLPFEV